MNPALCWKRHIKKKKKKNHKHQLQYFGIAEQQLVSSRSLQLELFNSLTKMYKFQQQK